MSSQSIPPTLADLARPEALKQPFYEPGKPIEDVARELGLDPATVSKLASNENPLGPSPLAIEAGRRALDQVRLYPDGGACALRGRLAGEFDLSPDQFLLGNGSNEVFELLGHVFLNPGDEVVSGWPAFIVCKLVSLLFGARPVEVPLVDHRHDLDRMAAAVTERTKLVYLPSPNNPTGTANSIGEIEAFVRDLPPHVVFVFDEAYAEYLDDPPDLRPLIAEGRKVICTRTFSKIHGLAGLRVGYGYGSPEMIGLLNRVRQPFNLNAVAQAAALAALDDPDHVLRCRQSNAAGLETLATGFERLGLEFVPSVANFISVKVADGAGVFEKLQAQGLIVRPMAGYGMGEWVRVSVGTPTENELLLEKLGALTRGPSGSMIH